MRMKACLITLLQRSAWFKILGAVLYWLVISMQGPVQLTTMLIVVTLQITCLTRCHWGMTSRRFCLSDITQTRGGWKVGTMSSYTFTAPRDCSFSMAGSQVMNQGSALALPMAAPALWIIWSHHLLCLIVPHHLLYKNALYSLEKGVIPTTGHFHSTWSYLGNMCHQQLQNLVQTSVVSNMMLANAHNIVNTYNNRLPSAQHRWVTRTMLTWSCSCCRITFVTPLRLCMAALRHALVQHNIVINHGLILNVTINIRKYLHMQNFILTAV